MKQIQAQFGENPLQNPDYGRIINKKHFTRLCGLVDAEKVILGSYHGKAGFDAFSHVKSIVDKKTWIDLPMRYQPYTSRLYEAMLHIFLR